jgi:uncharacterized protein (DUF58 family)
MKVETFISNDEYATLLDAVRVIRWPARSVVRGAIPGAHASRSWGTSAEFTEYRPYRQGDDLRRIDWKLFARSDRAYIRLSNDHSVLSTMIVLDSSASMAFPVATSGKWRLAAQVGVGLAAVARNSGDPVGLAIAGGDVPVLMPPRMRRSALHEIMQAMSRAQASGTASLAPAVAIAASRAVGRVVIVTDLLGDTEELMAIASRLVVAGSEVHVIHVIAPEEIEPARDAATVIDPEDPSLRRALIGETRDGYVRAFSEWRERIAHELSDVGVAYTVAIVGEEPVEHLIRRITAPRGTAVTT